MGDSFTNFLLVTLIALLGFIGKVFYEKLEEFADKIQQILLEDIKSNKNIERLDEITNDHEKRISKLEE